MRFDFITLFPEMCESVLNTSILKKGREEGLIETYTHNPRDFAKDNHKSVDDTPYGGGQGMVLRVDIFDEAISKVEAETSGYKKKIKILMTPQGKTFTQRTAEELSKYDQITLISGHYEGFDERIRSFVDLELSIGDYVLTGGELPSLIITDAVSRLVPGVIKEESHQDESFSIQDKDGNYLLEYPQYTRPLEYKGMVVPDVLLSGNHAEIAKWRLEKAKEKTEQNTQKYDS